MCARRAIADCYLIGPQGSFRLHGSWTSADLHELLLRLEERSNPATDTTHYGNSRVSATSFYQHYARHIGAAVQDAFGVEMLRVEACLGQAWLKRQRVLRDPGLIDDPRPPPKRREPSA